MIELATLSLCASALDTDDCRGSSGVSATFEEAASANLFGEEARASKLSVSFSILLLVGGGVVEGRNKGRLDDACVLEEVSTAFPLPLSTGWAGSESRPNDTITLIRFFVDLRSAGGIGAARGGEGFPRKIGLGEMSDLAADFLCVMDDHATDFLCVRG